MKTRMISNGLLAIAIVVGLTTVAQNQEQPKPPVESKHFAGDGLSFDYPATWELKDESTKQMQFIQLTLPLRYGDVQFNVRTPREWLKTPQKEAEAKRLIQDNYVSDFVRNVESAGLRPTRSAITTQIAGEPAEGTRIRVQDSNPGGMDAYYRVISDRFVQLSVFGSDRDIGKAAAGWDLIRSSIKVDGPPEPTPTPAKKP